MAKLINEDDINGIIHGIGVDDKNRFGHFYDNFLKYKMTQKAFNIGLKKSFIGTDHLYPYRREIKILFGLNEVDKKLMMNKEELNYYNNLDDSFKIYRAMTVTESNTKDYGVSWTTSEDIAEFYLNYRRDYQPDLEKVVVEQTIQKEEVVAYINERDEKEIIYLN